jgi:hypothetical protein
VVTESARGPWSYSSLQPTKALALFNRPCPRRLLLLQRSAPNNLPPVPSSPPPRPPPKLALPRARAPREARSRHSAQQPASRAGRAQPRWRPGGALGRHGGVFVGRSPQAGEVPACPLPQPLSRPDSPLIPSLLHGDLAWLVSGFACSVLPIWHVGRVKRLQSRGVFRQIVWRPYGYLRVLGGDWRGWRSHDLDDQSETFAPTLTQFPRLSR